MKPDTKAVVDLLFKISALHRISRDFSAWLEHGYFDASHCKMVREELKRLTAEFKKYAISLTDAFQPYDELMDCMIAPSDGDLYKSIKSRIFSGPKVFERISNWKDLVARSKL